MRRSGGNFASGYRWRDGVGPVEDRPARVDLAWGAIEPNTFGTNEFVRFCRTVGAEPYLVVNCGDGDLREARDWVEYCNGTADTALARQRAADGFPEPHRIRYWGIGNEVDGAWQLGAKSRRRIRPGLSRVRQGDALDGPEHSADRRGDVGLGRGRRGAGQRSWSTRPRTSSTTCRSTGTSATRRTIPPPISRRPRPSRLGCRPTKGLACGLTLGQRRASSRSRPDPARGRRMERLVPHDRRPRRDAAPPARGDVRPRGRARGGDAPQRLRAPRLDRPDGEPRAARQRHRADRHDPGRVVRQTIYHPFALVSGTAGRVALDAWWDGDTFSGGDHAGVRTFDVSSTFDPDARRLSRVRRQPPPDRSVSKGVVELAGGRFGNRVARDDDRRRRSPAHQHARSTGRGDRDRSGARDPALVRLQPRLSTPLRDRARVHGPHLTKRRPVTTNHMRRAHADRGRPPSIAIVGL